ncbi:SitI3 family protein [Nocardia camponoti]|uniref:SitI3 family protein n=1 Tax=Nocardia camponoti TaxID=1616106 RepID=UPI001663F62C|nr:SitI3 family protein [Nocardia camponoti]
MFIAAGVLAAVPGDAILYFPESGTVWALRRNGRLEIDDAGYRWTPERTEWLREPFVRKSYVL